METTIEANAIISDQNLQALKTGVRGIVISPHDPTYDEARKVFNGSINKHPTLIIKCKDVADVKIAVDFARNNKLLLAIKGGGHNGAGLGMCDDGLVIDLSLMRGVYVEAETKTVRAEAGCLLSDIDHASHAYGLAVPCGINGTTGIAGLTLGGGLGYLTRKYGLTIDNLLEADIVLASGEIVKVNATQRPDLFWALRGGGGNFGVVTSFLFKAHPISTVYAGPMFWHLDRIKEIEGWYRTFIKEAPDDLNGFFALHKIPPGPPFPEQFHLKNMCGVVWCYTGPLEKAEELFAPIRKFKPDIDFVSPMPLPMLQTLFDGLFVPGMQWYWTADFFNDIPDAMIDIHAKLGESIPSFVSGTHLYPINGKASRVGKKDTAWNYRDATWAMVLAGVEPDPQKQDAAAWAKKYWKELHPYSAGGAYVNFMMDEGNDRVKATYGENYKRLVEVKKKYDPENLFRVNQNIKPA